MKTLIALLLLGLSMSASAQTIQGRWKLTAAEDLRADGTVARYPWGGRPIGSIVVQDGQCYVQIMSGDVPSFAAGNPPVGEQMRAALLSTYIAYSGPCTINERAGSVTLKVAAAWRPDYVGTEQTRFFRFENGKMFFGPAPGSIRAGGETLTRRLTLEPAARTLAPGREAHADIPGARLWYRDTGGPGVPVVFLHANTGSSRVWEYQIPAFVARGYRLIAYDRRGFGRTVIDPAGVQPGTGADDLLALMNHLGIDRFHLVGTAAGGFVALDFALSFPQRLRSLVFANSIGGVQDEDYLELGRRLRPSPQFNALPPDVRELGPSYRAANPQGAQRWIELERVSRPEGSPPPAQTMRNRITFSVLEGLKVPTLLLTGDADLYAPPAVLRLFAARIKGAESVIVPETGHSAYWEQPEIFNRTVLEFIGKR